MYAYVHECAPADIFARAQMCASGGVDSCRNVLTDLDLGGLVTLLIWDRKSCLDKRDEMTGERDEASAEVVTHFSRPE